MKNSAEVGQLCYSDRKTVEANINSRETRLLSWQQKGMVAHLNIGSYYEAAIGSYYEASIGSY